MCKPPRQKFFEFSPPLQWRGIPVISMVRLLRAFLIVKNLKSFVTFVVKNDLLFI